jgi:CheY-like chemotaxis protein
METESRTVIVIESNAVYREGMAAVLRKAGFAVSLATNASAALTYPATAPRPDVIILDIMMPDGLYFLDKRKSNPDLANVPVLIITGFNTTSQEWTTSLGAGAVLNKPVDAPELLREVERLSRPQLGERCRTGLPSQQ